MISQGSVSFPVSSFSTSRRNCSFGSTRALCNQVAQSNSCPSLPARTSHRYLPSSTNLVSFSTSLRCSQARISLILVSTNWARRRLSLGSIGGFLVMKLVKPIKAFRSWPPDESGLDQLRASETKPNIRTAAARVLGETDAAVGQELARLDLPDGRFDQLPELAPLLI